MTAICDLAVANDDSDTVSILLNNGAGAFAIVASLPTGSFVPEGVVAVDLDGDHDVDLAVWAADDAVVAQNAVLVFKNLGGAVFSGFSSFSLNALSAAFIAAADLDLDGDLDVATSNEDSNNVSVLANDGLGGFGAPIFLAVGAGTAHVVAGDLDGDQVPDLVATNGAASTISVLANLAGNGTLSLLAAPAIGTTVPMQVSSQPDAGDPYVARLLAGQSVPGVTLLRVPDRTETRRLVFWRVPVVIAVGVIVRVRGVHDFQ